MTKSLDGVGGEAIWFSQTRQLETTMSFLTKTKKRKELVFKIDPKEVVYTRMGGQTILGIFMGAIIAYTNAHTKFKAQLQLAF